MEPLETITAALDDVFAFQRDISHTKLLTPLPLVSKERQAMLVLAEEQEGEANRLLLRVRDLKKAAILKRFSYATARCLPPEFLGNVFILAIPEQFRFYGRELPEYSVLEVNKWWRSVALRTSDLWTQIILHYSSASSITNLAIWLERARNSKLEIDIYGWKAGADEHIKETMWLMICRHLNHCSKLIHHSESSITNKHIMMLGDGGDICKDMISLELLTDYNNLDAAPPSISPSLPRLRYLSLMGGFAKQDIQFKTPCLEKLRLSRMDIALNCRSLCDILNRYPVAFKLELDCVVRGWKQAHVPTRTRGIDIGTLYVDGTILDVYDASTPEFAYSGHPRVLFHC